MAAILKEDAPAIADSGKQAPAELELVIERCLAKNPAQRFHSAQAFGEREIPPRRCERDDFLERPVQLK